MAPWAQHGAVDAPLLVPNPNGPLFAMMQSLGTELLAVKSSSNESVPLALGTLRKWATCLTVSVVVNATAPEGVCLTITGLSKTVLSERCGPKGEGRPAATAVELSAGGGNTTTRLLPCMTDGSGPPGSATFTLGGGGAVTSLSFALTHL